MRKPCSLAQRQQAASLGRKQGRLNVETGRLGNLRTPEHQRAAGRANAASGHIQRIQKAACPLGGRKQCHLRWHVARAKFNPNCVLCVEEFYQTDSSNVCP
jgi:hypothetical protein